MLRTGWVSALVCVALATSAQTAWAASGKPTIGADSVCAIPQPGQARCLADEKTVNGSVVAANSPGHIGGFGPSDLQSAYPVGSSGGAGQTVAVVDATDDPNAESDLAVYRAYYNLPPCTTANGCFKKVDQTGGSSFSAPDSGWAMEISLDLDMVSALCPNCHIVLVESFSSGLDQLGYAENEAANLGAVAISNSYGACENQLSQGMETGLDAYYNHPGVAITVSTGDGGYGSCGYYGGGLASPEYPSVSQYVTAVGGTSLSHSGSTWGETVWNGSESGCSQWEPKPAWQTDTGCSNRTVADVAAVADPSTGVAVSDSYSTGTQWEVLGGTSVSAPLVAAAYALGWAGGPSLAMPGAQAAYLPTTSLRDITAGSNGSCGTYFCQAQAGYDGPTGVGSPISATQVSGGTSPNPSVVNITNSVDLGRYFEPGGGHWVTTGAVSSGFVGGNPGFEEEPLGGLSTSGGAGFQALYSCSAGGGSVHFMSFDSQCERQQTLGLDGYSLSVAAPNTVEIFRCRVVGTNDHFVTLGPGCEGQQGEGSLGWITINVHIARAYNGSIHASFSGSAASGYSFEQTSGNTQAFGGGVLYNCRMGVRIFTSTDSKCEGQVQIGVLASGFASSPGVGLSALYRCYLPAGGDHYDTTSPTCEGAPGAISEYVLAYVSAS